MSQYILSALYMYSKYFEFKEERDRGNLRSCPHVLLSHPAGFRRRQKLPAAKRGTSVYVWKDGGGETALCVIQKCT